MKMERFNLHTEYAKEEVFEYVEDGDFVLYEDVQRLEEKYLELLYQVSIKHPRESRHETALRYIKEAEIFEDSEPCRDATVHELSMEENK